MTEKDLSLGVRRSIAEMDAAKEAASPNASNRSFQQRQRQRKQRRYQWAELLQRVFEIDALRCPRCGSRMRVLAAITDPSVARRILECIGLPARAPPLQSPALASAGRSRTDEQAKPGDSFNFDQSPPSDWDFGA